MSMGSKASAKHWNDLNDGIDPYAAPRDDAIRAWIEDHFARREGATCLEIGCYPGRYLAVFGDLGYELSGMDITERLDDLSAWLEKRGYAVGAFWKRDFLDFHEDVRFDVVASFGFIEHFEEWEAVLERHADFVEADGFLVLEAPNFLGTFQHWFHRTFDGENLARHHVPAMDVDGWARVLERRGFEIVYKGYFGRFDFWYEPERRSGLRNSILRAFSRTKRILGGLLPVDRKCYSPFCGVIARKARR